MKGDTRCIEGRLFRHDPQPDDPDLETDIGQCPECEGNGCERFTWQAGDVELLLDPRDPDPSRPGIFRDHNCWKCQHGAKPCVVGNPRNCEFPHARND